MEPFDRFIWRINGVILLFIFLGGAGALVIMILFGLLFHPKDHSAPAVAAVNEHVDSKEILHFGDNGTVLEGTSVFRIPMMVTYDDGISTIALSSKGYGHEIRNYLYLTLPDMTSSLLLPGFGQLIQSSQELYKPVSGDERRNVGTVFTVIPSDTNKDGVLNREDKIDIRLANANGKILGSTIEGCSRIHSIDQVNEAEVLVVYEKDLSTIAVLFSIADGTPIAERTISQ